MNKPETDKIIKVNYKVMKKITIIIEEVDSNRAITESFKDTKIILKTQISPREYELICSFLDDLRAAQVNV